MKNNLPLKKRAVSPLVETRIQIVTRMFLQGYSRAEITRFVAVSWGLKTRQTDNYILKAKTAIKECASKEKDYQKCLALARFEDLYKNAYKDGNIVACQSIQNSINKLKGLNADINVNASVSIKGSISPEK